MTTQPSTLVDRSDARPGTRRLPDFLIIGAAKSGTSTLTDYLRLHPRIWVSPIKEPEFFAVDRVYERGFDWYRELFESAGPDQFCCEASTAYTRWPQLPSAAARIAQALPNAKLIYLMRHPIDRAYSHYVHRVTKEVYPGQPIRWTFEEHVANDPMCLDGSRYMDQIEQYLRYYPKGAFLFLFTDELNRDPKATLSKVWRFLGIPDIDPGDEPLVSNETGSQREGKIRAQTTGPLRSLPGLYRLAKEFPQSWRDGFYRLLQKSRYGRWMRRRHTPPKLLPETRRRLVDEFREGNERLSKFLGVDLSHWSS